MKPIFKILLIYIIWEVFIKNNSTKLLFGVVGLYLVLNLIVTLFWTPEVAKTEQTKVAEPIEYVGIAKDTAGKINYWIGKSMYKKDDYTYKIILKDDKYLEVTSTYFLKIPVYSESDLQAIKTQYNLTDTTNAEKSSVVPVTTVVSQTKK